MIKKLKLILLCFVITTLLAAISWGQINFIEHSVSDTFSDSWSVFAADMDNDQDIDLISSGRMSNRIAWWENLGNHAFDEHVVSVSAQGAMGLYAVDLDEDGDMDVVCALDTGDRISWWENDGEQNFTESVIGNWDGPNYVWIEDVDRDDDWDVLVSACEAGNSCFGWFENDGEENFTEHVILVGWDRSNSIFCVDLDDDEDMDILGTASYAGQLVWFENDGSQNYSQNFLLNTWGRPSCCYGIDLDRDDDMDILTTICQQNMVVWFENDGNQVFTQNTIGSSIWAPHSVFPVDFNNDGYLDVVVAAILANEVRWFENDGLMNWTEHSITTDFTGATDVFPEDIDGDGDVDIFASARDGDRVSWFENDFIMDVRTIEEIILTDDGNGDGRADPGETCDLIITISSHQNGFPVIGAAGELSCDDPAVVLINSEYMFGDILPGTVVSNQNDPFVFNVEPCDPHWVQFTLTLTYGDTTEELPFDLELGRPPVLFVDDDGGNQYEEYYLDSFTEMGLFVDVWDESEGYVSQDELMRYQVVLWETGDATATIDYVEQIYLQEFLNSGGNLLLSSKNAGEYIGGTSFYSNYLHAECTTGNFVGALQVYGVDGCPFASSTDSLFLVGSGGAGNYVSCDGILPVGGASAAYTHMDLATLSGIYFEGNYKVVYLAFPLEAVTSLLGSPSRADVIAGIFEWFDFVGVQSEERQYHPRKFALGPVYPNPFNTETVIAYQLSVPGHINLSIYNLSGRLLGSPLQEVCVQPGYHRVTFNAADFPSGIYLVRLTAGDLQETEKVVLLK